MKQVDEIIYDAIKADSDLMTAIGGRVVSTCFEIPPTDEDNTPLPNIIITDDGFQNQQTTKDCVWNFVETGSILRWLFLLIAGSIGPFGIVLFIAFLLYYLISADAFGTPLLAPFSPLIPTDLRDSFVKYNLFSLSKRPKFLNPKNKTRLRS